MAILMLVGLSLSVMSMTGTAAPGNTIDITGLRITPNPGYSCENTTISFNVTNNLGTMVDLVEVHVDAKSSVGGMSWQSNITLFANGATSFQSFTWTTPPEGTYDVAITVIGAGQIAQKSGVYTVLPCAAHVYIGSVTIVKSPQAPSENATVTVEVGNDGHAAAYNTTVAVQATGPYPDTTRYFIGSTVVPEIAASGASHPDFMWAPLPASGVYTVTVMAIDEAGVMMSKDVSLVVDLMPRPNTVEIKGISVDPWPPMHGQESTVTAGLMFTGNWTGVPVTVMAYADGPSSYKLYNITLKEVMISGLVAVNFSWPATIEPGQYNLTVMASMFNPKEYTISKIAVTQLARQKQWLPANFRLEIRGIAISPYPPLPGQNSTVTVEIANTGDLDAPPAKLTVTAEGPAFYNLGTRTTPSTSFGTMVRMEFNWTQPVVPGEYIVRAFLEDIGGNQSDLKSTFVLPHVLESNLSVVNGTTIFNYYYYGAAPNGSQGQNITVVVPATLNETEAAATGLSNPAIAGVAGVAAGGVVSIASVLAYGMLKRRGQMTDVQSNPMYKENANAGQNPMYQEKGMAGENPLYIHERMVHGVHRGEGVAEPQEASLVGGALPGGAVVSSAVSSGVRESPSRPSTGQTSIRESPTLPSTGSPSEAKSKVAAIGRVETPLGLQGVRESPTLASTGVKAPRDSASGQATGKRQHGPVAVTDEDGDASSDTRMAVATKGLPGKSSTKKDNQAHRVAGDGEDLPTETVDPGDAPPEPDLASNPIPGVGIVVKRGADYGSALRESPTRASGLRESPTLASTGRTSIRESPTEPSGIRESPTRASTGIATEREAGRGMATGRRQYGPGSVTDADGDASSDARMAINEKGLPGKKKPSTQRLAGDGTETIDDDSDDDGLPEIQGMAINEKGLPGDKKPTKTKSHARTAGGEPLDDDSDDDGLSDGDERKGWDGTVKGVKVDEGEALWGSKKGYDYYQAQSQLNSAGKLRESPTRASGLRESPTGSDFAIKEQGVKSSQAPPPAGDLDGDGAPELRAQNNGTTRSNRGAAAPSDITVNEEGVKMMKEEGGRHTPFHNKVAPEEAAGVDGIKGHRDVGGYRAPEGTEGSGGGSRAQDHNSSRSNKTATLAPDSSGGPDAGTGETGPDGKLTAADLEAQKHTKTGHVTLMK